LFIAGESETRFSLVDPQVASPIDCADAGSICPSGDGGGSDSDFVFKVTESESDTAGLDCRLGEGGAGGGT
jgi:hypothetical protein